MTLLDHKHDLGNCTYCPKLCRFCCPNAQAECSDTVTPWAKMSLAELMRQKRLDLDQDTASVFYHCFTCLHCHTHCRHGVDVPSALIEARAMAVKAQLEPVEVSALVGRFYDSGNPWGEDLYSLLESLVDKKYFAVEAQACVFPGCQAIRQGGEYIPRMMELFSVLDISYLSVYHDRDLCCGLPLWQSGEFEGFKEHARVLASKLKKYRTIVCPCPSCAWALKTLVLEVVPQFSGKILHFTEFVGSQIKMKQPQRRLPGKYFFHDPCYLARYLGQTDAPRKILDIVLEEPLLQSVWQGKDASCCGGGGQLQHVLRDVAGKVTKLRMEQLAQSGAKKIITACPGCLQKLKAVDDKIEVEDIISILRDAYC